MDYQESLDWIHSKLKFGIKPGLKRMEWMLEQLGNPQDKIRGVHIVGTNGKGSTVANLQHIFKASGYKVGTFTSPYILDFRERISVNGQMISQEGLVDLVNRVQPIVEALPSTTGLEPATEFEIITVMMFLYFAEIERVDVVLVEAGLGGRLDSTNVFKPLAVICPSIGLDHQDILGETHAEIATEKAGAIKKGVPFIFATQRSDVRQVFLETCQALAAPAYELGRDFSLAEGEYRDETGEQLSSLTLGLPGRHQEANAGLAIKTSLLLQERYPKLSHTTIGRGLSETRWIGRTELVEPNLMLDGAHNQESVEALVQVLKENYADKTIHILFAALATKPVLPMLETLAEIGQVKVTSVDYPKAMPLEHYPETYGRVATVTEWLASREVSEDDFYLITGSLYFISQVRQLLLKSWKK